MADRNSFIFYRDWYNMLMQAPPALKTSLLDAILNYAFTGVEPDDATLKLLFSLIKQRIDADGNKWDEIRVKRSEAGKKHKGNQYTRAKEAEQMEQVSQNGTNGTVNVNGNVNVNGTQLPEGSMCVNSIEKENTLTSVKENAADAAARAKNAFQERIKKFYAELVPYTQTYGKKMIRDFFDYWTEPNKSGTKFRKELEKTWSTPRRLQTWASREKIDPTAQVINVRSEAEAKRRNQLTAEDEQRAAAIREARLRMLREREQNNN